MSAVILPSGGSYCHFYCISFHTEINGDNIRTRYRLKSKMVRQGGGVGLPLLIIRAEITGWFFATLRNFLKPTGHVMHQHFNIQQLYFLPTLYLCVLYLSENKQRLVSLTA